MAKTWEMIPPHNKGLQSSQHSVARRHWGDELSNFVRSNSSRCSTLLTAFVGRGWILASILRPGYWCWSHSVSLLLNIGVEPLFPKRDLIPLRSRRKQTPPVNTRIWCSVWPGEITETRHTLNVEQQLELLQMYDCAAADWKKAQFHNKVSQKCSTFGQFYAAAACSTDSTLWWLGAEPLCASVLVFILCGLHVHKCTQMEDFLLLPTGQL